MQHLDWSMNGSFGPVAPSELRSDGRSNTLRLPSFRPARGAWRRSVHQIFALIWNCSTKHRNCQTCKRPRVIPEAVSPSSQPKWPF